MLRTRVFASHLDKMQGIIMNDGICLIFEFKKHASLSGKHFNIFERASKLQY
jgi:hypothetical protein